jgi:hypothetical protein
MKKRLQIKFILIFAGFSLAAVFSFSAFGAGTLSAALAPDVQMVSGAGDVSCSSMQYKENNPPNSPQYMSAPYMKATCTQCQQSVTKWKQQMPGDAATASTADQGIANSATPGIGNSSSNVGSQLTSQNNASGQNFAPGAAAQAQRGTNATGAAGKFQACASEVQSACSGGIAQEDKSVADQVQKGCQNASKDASQYAGDKANDASQLGDLSKLAQAAAQALGPLAQMMGAGNQQPQQQQPSAVTDNSGTSPTPSSVNTDSNGNTTTVAATSTVPGTSLGTNTAGTSSSQLSPLSTSNLGNGLASGSNVVSPVAGAGGYGSGNGSGKYGFADMGAKGTGFGGAMGAGAGFGATGGSAGGAGSPTNSTGASGAAAYATPGDGSGDAAKEDAYDFGASGGKPMFGLKGKSSEEKELEGMAGANGNDGANPDLKGDRELASNGEGQNGDGGGGGGLSIFHMVRTRYAELKRTGRI